MKIAPKAGAMPHYSETVSDILLFGSAAIYMLLIYNITALNKYNRIEHNSKYQFIFGNTYRRMIPIRKLLIHCTFRVISIMDNVT